jgi:hypothetical protein
MKDLLIAIGAVIAVAALSTFALYSVALVAVGWKIERIHSDVLP